MHELSTLSERLIGMRYRQKFGLRMMEVGILIMVGNAGALSFKTTYKEANLEKSSASRLATQLLEKGLLEKRQDPADQRSFYLGLTADGNKLYRQLYRDALRRNERWMAALMPARFQRIRSTHWAREGPGSNRSPKYWVSRATFPSLNSMMLTV